LRNDPMTNSRMKLGLLVEVILLASVSPALAQQSDKDLIGRPPQVQTSPQPSAAPLTITLQDALARARQNEPQFLAAQTEARSAREDRVQAKASLLPGASLRSDFLNTQGNGILPSGRYVTNDGVHVYREWGVVHQDLSANTFNRTTYRRSMAVEAQALARAEVAQRGLTVTVTRAYYALVGAQRKYATAQQSLQQSNRFLMISQDLERGGEVAHSDVVKLQLQQLTQEQALREATLALETTRLDLAVLVFPDFNENFQVVDDLQLVPSVPPLPEVQAMAARDNPDLRVAMNALRAASYDITIARQALLPSLAVDMVYGLEANQVALHAHLPADPNLRFPTLGYFLTASLTVPTWDWGLRRSRIRQTEIRRQQAQVELTAAQRQVLRNLNAAYQEVQTARDQVNLLRNAADLAAESLRLNTLRYQAGEATVLDLVDAQNTLTSTLNGLDDAQIRYKVAIATLQTVTGPF